MWLKSDKHYLRFDEKSNTYDSLEKLLFFLNNIENDLNFWKWAIIALHSSVYGAMILSLLGSHPDRVSKFPIKKRKMHSVDETGKPIILETEDTRLISFPEAFRRIQNEKFMRMYVKSVFFKTETRHKESMEWLNDRFRNQFIHFVPVGWSIEIKGLTNLFRDCLEIIEFCLFQSGNVLLEEDERKLFEKVVENIKNHEELK